MVMQISLLGSLISTISLPSLLSFTLPSSAYFCVVTFTNSLDPEQAILFDPLFSDGSLEKYFEKYYFFKRNKFTGLGDKKYAKLLRIWVFPA